MVVNWVGNDKGKPMNLYSVRLVVDHRLSLANKTEGNPNPVDDRILNGFHVIEAFRNPLMGTGGRPPYHLLIKQDALATVDQMLPLAIKGAHASGVNWCSIAVAVAGNTDERAILPQQYQRLIGINRLLAPLNGGLIIRGHDEIPGARKDDGKQCPGRFLSMDAIRAEVAICQDAAFPENPIRVLEQAGIRL